MSNNLEDRFLRYRAQLATLASGIVALSSGILLFGLKEPLLEIILKEKAAHFFWFLSSSLLVASIILGVIIPYKISRGYMSEARREAGQQSSNSNEAFLCADKLMPWLLGCFITSLIVGFLVMAVDYWAP